MRTVLGSIAFCQKNDERPLRRRKSVIDIHSPGGGTAANLSPEFSCGTETQRYRYREAPECQAANLADNGRKTARDAEYCLPGVADIDRQAAVKST